MDTKELCYRTMAPKYQPCMHLNQFNHLNHLNRRQHDAPPQVTLLSDMARQFWLLAAGGYTALALAHGAGGYLRLGVGH